MNDMIVGIIPIYRHCLILALFCFVSGQMHASGNRHEVLFGGQYHFQYIWPHRTDLAPYAENKVTSFEVNLGLRTSGKNHWHQLYNRPAYGIGFSYFDLGNPDVLGIVRSGFAFLEVPLGQSGFQKRRFKLSVGLSHFDTYYHPRFNPENRFIGTPWNLHFNLNYAWLFYLGNHLEISPGVAFTHFSNGAARAPNRGLNLFDANIGLRFMFGHGNPGMYVPENYHVPAPGARQNLFITYSVGQMQRENEDHIYRARTISLNTTIRKGMRMRWGVGLDFVYDDHSRQQVSMMGDIDGFMDYVTACGFVSGDIVFNRLSIMLNLGTYLYYGYEPEKLLFSRIGLRYFSSLGILAHLALKSHDGRADYVEWGLGYGFSF